VIYIGLSVLVQGYIAADQSKVCHELSDGTTLRQHINQTGFTMALSFPEHSSLRSGICPEATTVLPCAVAKLTIEINTRVAPCSSL
jgi:hypothetical protein